MYWWKQAGHHGALLFIAVALVTPTVSYILPNETTPWPQEPDCTLGAENAKICACDPQCAQYGDCCRSSPYFVPEQQRQGASPFTCMSLLLPTNIYVMTTCPPDWKDSDTRYRCEHPDSIHRDPLLDAPVKSMSTNITYLNWHCAYCHGDLDANTTVIWNARFKCKDYCEQTYVPDEILAERLSFNPLTFEWNLNISHSTADTNSGLSYPGIKQCSINNNKQDVESVCSLIFTAPINASERNRKCDNSVINKCSESWENAEVRTQCEAYTARVCSGGSKYRNHHCMLCNYVAVPEPCSEVTFFFYEVPEMPSLTMLLDWRRLKRGACESSEIYDPLSRVCRKVFT